MKKYLFFAAFILLAVGANAQLSYGVKGGVNFATISNYDNISIPGTVEDIYDGRGDVSYRTGYNVGLLVNYGLANGFVAFQTELLYSNQGMKNSGYVDGLNAAYSSTVKTDYINIPMMVQVYFIPKVLFVEAGPQFGFLVNAKSSVDASFGGLAYNDEWDIKDNINTFDFSLAGGVGFQLPKLPLGINARYTIGLNKVDKNSDENDNTYNGVFQVGAFLKFGGH